MKCMALIVAVALMPIAAVAAENRKVQLAFEKLDKALAIEAESLQKNNKAKEAKEILSSKSRRRRSHGRQESWGVCGNATHPICGENDRSMGKAEKFKHILDRTRGEGSCSDRNQSKG